MATLANGVAQHASHDLPDRPSTMLALRVHGPEGPIAAFDRTPTSRDAHRGLGWLLLLAAISLAGPSGEVRAQEGEVAEDAALDVADRAMSITAHHPLTGEELPSDTPHPFGGVFGDGIPDKIPYNLSVEYEVPLDPRGPTGREIGNDLVWGNASVLIAVAPGELSAPQGVQNDSDVFCSTIISQNMQNAHEGPEITGTVAGRTGLEFADDYLKLSGRGEVTYEDFHVSMRALAPIGSCNFLTSTTDGYFTVPEIVLFRDSLPPPVSAPDPGAALSVDQAVFRIEPGIDESLTIDCSM